MTAKYEKSVQLPGRGALPLNLSPTRGSAPTPGYGLRVQTLVNSSLYTDTFCISRWQQAAINLVHVRYMSSSVRLSSVCLSSVCNVRAPYSDD